MVSTASDVLELAERVSVDGPRLLPVGGRTKPALSFCGSDVELVDTRGLSGVTAYDPSEYLITAQAGTPISELIDLLAEHGQYLPFDPPLADAGSTIGGSLAAGLSGPNRLLYGGIRDFVMEIEFIDGLGKVVRGGGKVVKNAAGFDLPKLLVGSYGRMGILTEVTLKVFPRPASFSTIYLTELSLAECVSYGQLLQSQPLPIAAVDYLSAGALAVRFGGPAKSLPNVLSRASALIGRSSQVYSGAEDADFWSRRLADFVAPTDKWLVHVALAPSAIPGFHEQLVALGIGERVAYSGGGISARLSVDPSVVSALESLLTRLQLPAVVLSACEPQQGGTLTPFLGDQSWRPNAKRMQLAIDPDGRFASF